MKEQTKIVVWRFSENVWQILDVKIFKILKICLRYCLMENLNMYSN